MIFDNRIGNDWECLPPSCRDKGWTWSRVGALCLSCWPDEWSGLREANRSPPHEDKHKAPSSTPLRPLSLQDAGRPSPIRSAPFIRRLGRKRPNGYDYPIRLAQFSRAGPAGGEELSSACEPCLKVLYGSYGLGLPNPQLRVKNLPL